MDHEKTAWPEENSLLVNRKVWRENRLKMEGTVSRSTPQGPRGKNKKSIFEYGLDNLGLLLKYSGLMNRGVRNALDVQVKQINLKFDDLPDVFDGYRILHMSDLHIDALPSLADVLVQTSESLNPNLCVMTGDYRAGHIGEHGHIVEPMVRLFASINAPDGTWFTLGNHDSHDLGVELECLSGATLLANERVDIRRGEETLVLTGVDDPHRFYTEDAKNILARPVEGFGVALVHTPELLLEAKAGGHSLYLCGHTHGGQIAWPGGKPIFTRLDYNTHLGSGLWKEHGMWGYTSVGAGVTAPPVRFFTRSEVVLFTLNKSVPD